MAIWITLGIEFFLLIGSIIGISIKYSNKIAVLESQNKALHDDFKLHQSLNERAFNSLEKEMREVTNLLNQLVGYYKGKTNQDFGG